MVAGNLMTLCEIEPRDACRWFMEMFVDSADWVMVPNVYGMGGFTDGASSPPSHNICGSYYIRKMNDYPKPAEHASGGAPGPIWCDTMEGLYWRFVDKYRAFFRGHARAWPRPSAPSIG